MTAKGPRSPGGRASAPRCGTGARRGCRSGLPGRVQRDSRGRRGRRGGSRRRPRTSRRSCRRATSRSPRRAPSSAAAEAASNAARHASRRTASVSGERRPLSMYGKLNRSVASPSSRHAPREPDEERVVHPGAGAVRDHDGRERRPSAGRTSPTPVPSRCRYAATLPDRPSRAMMHAMAGTLHLGTSGFSFDGWKHGVFYPEGLKNREMLTYYSQQLSSVEINYTFRRFPSEKIAHGLARAGGGRLHVHAQGEPADHALQATRRHRRGRSGIPRAREAPRRQARVRPVPVPAVAALRPGADRGVRGLPPAGRPVRDGVPSRLVGRGEGPVAVPGRRVVRRRDRREGPRSRRPLVGADRLPATAQDRVLRRGAPCVGRPDRARRSTPVRTCSVTSSTRRTARVRRWRNGCGRHWRIGSAGAASTSSRSPFFAGPPAGPEVRDRSPSGHR